MYRVLLGAVGMLALQALLVWGYLAVNEQDPIVLNPDREPLDEHGVMMAVFCGREGGGALTKVPPTETRARGRGDRTVRVCFSLFTWVLVVSPRGWPGELL